MKKIIFVFLIISSLVFLPLQAMAQTEEEASPSPDDERIKQQVQERIENVLKAADESRKKALIGTLKAIANSALTIETSLGDAQAKLATDAAIINIDREEIELDDLAIGSKLIIMGYAVDETLLEAKRIAVREKFQTPETEPVFGFVTDISSEEEALTIKHPKTETVYLIEVGSSTTITKKIDEEVEEIDFDDIEEDDRLVIIGEPGENGEKMISANLIRVINQASFSSEE